MLRKFIVSFFSKVQIWVLGVKKFFFSFWLIFYPLDPDPWIRIFLRIRIQEAKILRIQRIRILSTDWDYRHNCMRTSIKIKKRYMSDSQRYPLSDQCCRRYCHFLMCLILTISFIGCRKKYAFQFYILITINKF